MTTTNVEVMNDAASDHRMAALPLELVWKRRLSVTDERDYDAFVRDAPAGHFAQTRGWSPVARAGRITIPSCRL